MSEKIVLYAAIGLVSGVISGMGIGGGAVLIPALVIFAGVSQTEAQGINLIYFIPTAIIALIVHFRNHNIYKKYLLRLIIFGVASAAAGSYLATAMPPELLRRLFGGFLLIVGVMELFKKRDSERRA